MRHPVQTQREGIVATAVGRDAPWARPTLLRREWVAAIALFAMIGVLVPVAARAVAGRRRAAPEHLPGRR